MNPVDLEALRKALAPFLRFEPIRGAVFRGRKGTRLHPENFERLRRVAEKILKEPSP